MSKAFRSVSVPRGNVKLERAWQAQLAAATLALKQAVITASNDDLSKPGTDKRQRHVARIDAMQDAIELLEKPLVS